MPFHRTIAIDPNPPHLQIIRAAGEQTTRGTRITSGLNGQRRGRILNILCRLRRFRVPDHMTAETKGECYAIGLVNAGSRHEVLL
jgi:hypothetical protein